jgi:Purine catabolism regulatory protein-like family/PucR C-terminal helix-turn-helix domain/GGDEF-like domain
MGETTRPALCLGDVLAEESFGFTLLSGGPDAAHREVRGAHAVEVDAPERWLARDWVMLTTGVRLRGNAPAQRELVPSLEAAGVSALGFGVGLGFKHVPAALLEVARERGFPVFAVPYETPFREIVTFVERSLSNGDEHMFRRLTALQRYLVDALSGPEPERALVDRLAGFLDAGVMLLGADGEPELVAGKPPVAELRSEIRAHPVGLLELDAGGWHAVAAPVAARAGEADRWLVLASPRPGVIAKLAKPAAEATAPLLAAMSRLGEVARDQELAVKAALLQEALEPARPRDLQPLAARAAAFGVDFASPARLVVVRRGPRSARGEPGGLRGELVAACEQARIPHLVLERDGALTALVQGADSELAPALALLAEEPETAIGVGRAVGAIADTHHSLRDAELAVAHAGGSGASSVVRFEDFDLGTFMVSEIAPERLGPKVEQILGVLRANPPLHEAISAYFEHDLDIAATAVSLHMHRNSLRYRLARLEQLLGRSLKQPATIAALYVALAAETAVGGMPKRPA